MWESAYSIGWVDGGREGSYGQVVVGYWFSSLPP